MMLVAFVLIASCGQRARQYPAAAPQVDDSLGAYEEYPEDEFGEELPPEELQEVVVQPQPATEEGTNGEIALGEEVIEAQSLAGCIDSDGGVNYNAFGLVQDVRGGTDRDYCTKSDVYTGRLYEFSCDTNGRYKRDIYDCPNGCEAGRCLTESEAGMKQPKPVVVQKEEVVVAPPKTEAELLAEYKAQLDQLGFETTYLGVYPATQTAKVGDELFYMVRIKNRHGGASAISQYYFKLLVRGTARDWIMNAAADIGSYVTIGPVPSTEAYVDIPVKLKVGPSHGLNDEFTTVAGTSYKFTAEMGEAKSSRSAFDVEDKRVTFNVNVVE